MTPPIGSPATLDREEFPPGLENAFWFATFNALSYPIILSSPMILFAKSLNASVQSVFYVLWHERRHHDPAHAWFRPTRTS